MVIDVYISQLYCLDIAHPHPSLRATFSYLEKACLSVTFDGTDVRDLTLHSLRDEVGVVTQETYLFNSTIRENLLYAKPDATEEEMIDACKKANIYDFISNQPDGLDTMVGNRGLKLSGGEKQRLSIARAVIKNAPIYIFDDSFSALDFLTESKLRTKLSKKAAGKTQIIITQRVTSAMNSDIILVMDNGKLVDSGKHTELLERCGIYREIYASQTGGAK